MKLVGRLSGGRKPQGLNPDALRRAARPERRLRSNNIEELRDVAERLNELAVMSLFLHSAGTMEEMLSLFLERSNRVTGAVVTYPLLLDRRRDVLQATPLANIEDRGLEQASLAAEVNLVDFEYPMPLRSWRQTVMDGGEVAITEDLRDALEDVLGKETCDQLKKRLELTKVATVPLVMEGECFGLCLFMFSGVEPDVEVLELGAGHCTLALKALMAGEESTRYGGMDPVTWIHSRGYMIEAIEAEVTRARRYGRGLSLVMFDIDDFSQFNANYGHTLGDRLLRGVAMTLAGSIALPESVARLGGDEFLVLLPETNRAAAVELTASLMKKLATLSVFADVDSEVQGVSCSVAIVSYPEDGGSRDELLAAMDIAIEQAKQDRREAMKPVLEMTAIRQLRLTGRRHSA